ncbi:phosphopantetheine-binding protein [Chitiniphilus eburneus]|uniref:Phosphopantetheine attachment domain protein n=1 Tax=Chitiniphilus eburneus TaxID=2571148 RepID=A0A4U0PHI2_9NEIS|nr:phosphopantetheine-binding protein [Chitiniphilus eburneus]TJZ67441.1 phosphopantetheine attachment domain protein [Chitiniphilus eburneus]
MNAPLPHFDRARFDADIAALLRLAPAELAGIDDPIDAGLDSVRLMVLVENWRRQGVAVAFVELVEHRSFDAWWALIAARR